MRLDALPRTLWRQRVVVVAVLLVGALLFAVTLTKGRKYTATSTILAVASSGGDSAALDPSKDPIRAAVMPQDVPNLLTSSTVLNRIAQDVHLTRDQRDKLGGEIKAKAGLGSNIIPVAVTDQDPARAVAVANAATKELQKFEQEIAMSRYDLLINDLGAQLATKRDALHALDDRLVQISTNDPYVSAETGTSAINGRLVTLEAQRDAIRTTLLGDASAANLAGRRPSMTRDLASREIVMNDPVFQSLRAQYGKDLAQLNLEQAGYTKNFSGLAGLQEQVQRENSSLTSAQKTATASPNGSPAYVSALLDKNKADASYASDRAQLAALNAQIAETTAHLNSARVENLAISALRRDRDAGNTAYATLSNRLATAIADRSEAASINSVVVMDLASGASPALLSRPPVLAAAFGIAFLWIAITLAFLLDGSDTRLRGRTTIEELYGSPVLTYVG